MLTYTYYTKETERPTAKLTAANVNKVFTAPTVLVKIDLLHTTYDDGEYSAWVHGGVLSTNVIAALRNANRVFDLLAKKGVVLGALAEDFVGSADYILFTRNNNGVYNMSLCDANYGLPQDIVDLRAAGKRAKDAQRKHNILRQHGKMSESAHLEATKATMTLKRAIMVSMAVEPGEHPTTVDTRARLLAETRLMVQ